MNRRERRATGKTDLPQQGVPIAVSELFAQAIHHANARQMQAAVSCFRVAVKIAPNLPVTHYNLGNALAESGNAKEAVFCFRKAIALRPDLSEAHANLAAALGRLEQFAQAEASALKAIQTAPTSALAYFNLGTILEAQRRLDEAASCYRKAVELKHDFAVAQMNLAMVYLTKADFEKGWEAYEWRWKTPQMMAHLRPDRRPQWRGTHTKGQTLLIWAEQGFGDTIQFCRYSAIAAAAGLRVIMQVQPSLVRLLQGSIGVDLVIAEGEPPPAYDLHCPMMSLPLAVGQSADAIPGAAYLSADETDTETWRVRIAETGKTGLRVGLVWAGSSRKEIPDAAAVDRRRSVRLEQLKPLLDIPGAVFFSLQKDHRTENQGGIIDLMSGLPISQTRRHSLPILTWSYPSTQPLHISLPRQVKKSGC